MATITIGSGYTDFGGTGGSGYSKIDSLVKADGTGSLDTFKAYWRASGSNVKLGTAYSSGGEGVYTVRDYETIGSVSSGSTQTYTGKNCSVSTNDCIWCYNGNAAESYGSSLGNKDYYKSGDQSGSGSVTYTLAGNSKYSFYATGATAAAGSLPLKNVFGRPFSGVFR